MQGARSWVRTRHGVLSKKKDAAKHPDGWICILPWPKKKKVSFSAWGTPVDELGAMRDTGTRDDEDVCRKSWPRQDGQFWRNRKP